MFVFVPVLAWPQAYGIVGELTPGVSPPELIAQAVSGSGKSPKPVMFPAVTSRRSL